MEFLDKLSDNIVSALSPLGIWYLIITNFVGVIAIILLAASFQMKSRKLLLLVFIFSQLCWAIYFILQGDLSSGVLCLFSIIMSLVFMQREKHKWANSIFWLFFFAAVMLACSILTFKNDWRNIFPLMGNLLTAISFYMLNQKVLRIINIGTYLCWMGNSISKFYIVALISDTATLLSVIISLLRLKFTEKKKDVKEEKSQTQNEQTAE